MGPLPLSGPAQTRRLLLAGALVGGLAGCGFKLRQAPNFAFTSLYCADATALGVELRRELQASDKLKVISDPALLGSAQVILEILGDQRERAVTALNSAGQVRELELRVRVQFRLRGKNGKELIPETELLQRRNVSYNSSVLLAKESEEELLYRDMQNDIVQQIMSRLAAVKGI
ncbi:MAG TPA: LPS assembly lipoprotein LptE [Rhodoferax sp.]|jgi:LPS-assembly lipoprotein|nr:LPS assembly lipoprotein LptE [Rhodoferax sp.]